MRVRRLVRVMNSVVYNMKEHVCGNAQYEPLSLNPHASNHDADREKKVECSTCMDPESQWSHRVDLFRQFATGHLPNIACIHVAALRVAFPDGVVSVALSVTVIILLLISLVHMLENNSIFAPGEPASARYLVDFPHTAKFPCCRVVKLKPVSHDGHLTIKCLFLLQADLQRRAVAPTILFFHGNAGNVGHRLPLCHQFYKSCGANVFLLEYRGFGLNRGFTSELGICADAMAALKYVTEQCSDIDPGKVFLYGRSLGGAVAIDLAVRMGASKVRGAIIENTFTSIADMGRSIGSKIIGSPIDYFLPAFAISNKFESLQTLKRKLPRLQGEHERVKFLFLSGAKDELIPHGMMHKLAKACATSISPPLEAENNVDERPLWIFDADTYIESGCEGLVIFPEGDHGTTWLGDRYFEVVNRFIQLNANIPID